MRVGGWGGVGGGCDEMGRDASIQRKASPPGSHRSAVGARGAFLRYMERASLGPCRCSLYGIKKSPPGCHSRTDSAVAARGAFLR